MTKKPIPTSSLADQELERCQKQFDAFDEKIKEMTLDRMNQAPLKEVEPQTKLSSKDLNKAHDIYLKPSKTISSREKFNERFRDEYEYAKQYVQFIAEHKEIKGERIEIWTKKFPGIPAEFWEVPTNKPVWGPRYLAEQIRSKVHHEFIMDPTKTVGTNQIGYDTGVMVVDTIKQRLTAEPVTTRRSVFMGASEF